MRPKRKRRWLLAVCAGLGLGGSAGLGLGGSPGAGQAVVQQPVARRSGGRVTLDWDPGVYPGVLVLDPATGRHLATLKTGAADFQDAGLDELELVLSDGLRSTGLRVPVQ